MNKTIALFLLKIMSLIWVKYFQGSVSGSVNTAVNNRYQTLLTAINAGNIPDISWAQVAKYLKLDDNSVATITLTPQSAWTAEDWSAAIAEKQRVIALEQAALATMQNQAAMVEMQSACITKLQGELADMQEVS